MENRKFSAAEILALFNKSKSEKSYVLIEDKTMFILSAAIFTMIMDGKIDSVEFKADGHLYTDDTKETVAYDTMKVAGFKESAIVALEKVSRLCVAYGNIDEAVAEKALALANKYNV